MRIAYCSMLLPEEKKLSERTKKRLPGISVHKVATAVINGIDANNDIPVDIINIINTVNYPKFPQLVFPTEKWNHTAIPEHEDYHIGYINVFGIKYITQYCSMRKVLSNWVSQSDDAGIICVQHIFLPSMLATVHVAKKNNNKIKICLNTGDVPGQYGLASQNKRSIKQILTEKLVDNNILRLAKQFDCFVFVTKDMAEAFNVEQKPFTVVECTYIEPEYAKTIVPTQNEQKVIFYAGSIRAEYGIDHLLRAFSLIDDSNYRLVIAGGGVGEELVLGYAKKDPRISFLGFITPQEVLKHQLESCVLVSPRQTNHEFVKYSFPSKAVDSLASGIPYVAHKLPCDPPEYADYIQYPFDESDEALKDKLVEICELSSEERKILGNKAKQFVLKEKNPKTMTKRIITMWEEVLKGQ